MKRKSFIISMLVCFVVPFFSGCTGNPTQHTYWLKNPTTGTYSAHRTYSPLHNDEIRELGLVKELPADAKTID